MVVKQFTVKNPSGIHAIYAAKISELAKSYESDVFIKKDKRVANCNSLISVLGLMVQAGDTITVMADGIDEACALENLMTFLDQLYE